MAKRNETLDHLMNDVLKRSHSMERTKRAIERELERINQYKNAGCMRWEDISREQDLKRRLVRMGYYQ